MSANVFEIFMHNKNFNLDKPFKKRKPVTTSIQY